MGAQAARLQAAERLIVFLRLQAELRKVEVARPVARQVARDTGVLPGRQRRQRLPRAPVAGAAVQRAHQRGARLLLPAPARCAALLSMAAINASLSARHAPRHAQASLFNTCRLGGLHDWKR